MKIDGETLSKLHKELFDNITTDGTMEGEVRLANEINEVLEKFS